MPKINNINNNSGSMTIDPEALTDSFVQFSLSTAPIYRMGVDYSAGFSFKMAQGGALGTNDIFIMTTSGENTLPLQPAFLVVRNTTVSNATGNGVNYTIAWDTVVFDQGGDFSSTTFTAPVTGKYKFEASVLLGDLASVNDNMVLVLVTSNRTYLTQANPGACRDSNNQFSINFTVLADMDASDTAFLQVTVSAGTQIIDVIGSGSATPSCWFSGNLEV